MKETGIIFKGPLVRAIIARHKTKTRRIAQWPKAATMHGRYPMPDLSHADGPGDDQYLHCAYTGGDLGEEILYLRMACPYGGPGDRLWVRETFATFADDRYDSKKPGSATIFYRAGCEPEPHINSWRPSIFLPRWASRLTLEITSVRVERLQHITTADITAEGVPAIDYSVPERPDVLEAEQRAAFVELWNKINHQRAPWSANCWVWVLGFKVESERKGAAA